MSEKTREALSKDLAEAERRARLRDFAQDPTSNHSEIMSFVNKATQELEKGGDYKVVKVNQHRDGIQFVQLIQKNLMYLQQKKYLTTSEKSFIVDILPYVGFRCNCIVVNISSRVMEPMNLTQIAENLGKQKGNIHPIISSLIDKGILAKAESGRLGNNARNYALFMNPHIAFAGARSGIEETLKVMFAKSMELEHISNLPVKLWKSQKEIEKEVEKP